MTTPAECPHQNLTFDAVAEVGTCHDCGMTWQLDDLEKTRAELNAARAELAEVRRRTAQRCAEIAVEARERWRERGDAGAEVAAGCIAQDIRREFALAEQPPQPQADRVCRCELFDLRWNAATGKCETCGLHFREKLLPQPVSPPAQDAGERHGKVKS
jgi:hypothetical protein